MADAAAHNKQVENLMGAEEFVLSVKNGKLQGIDHTADGIDDAACKKPAEGGMREHVPERSEDAETYPPHGNINNGRKPFRTGDPAGLQDHAKESDSPDHGKKRITQLPAKDDQADRRVGACNQHKDHHMIDFAENAQRSAADIQ